jgi:flavodoxin
MARIVVLYSSLGGNTRQMADHVAAGRVWCLASR